MHTRNLVVALGFLLMPCGLAMSQTVATFIGPEAGSLEDPANWDIGIAPFNNGVTEYVLQNISRSYLRSPGVYEISGVLNPGGGAQFKTLSVNAAATLTVAGPMDMDIVRAFGSNARLILADPADSITETYTQIEAIDGQVLSTATRVNEFSTSRWTGSFDLYADGPTALIDFSNLIRGKFGSRVPLEAHNGATIDLSAMTSFTYYNNQAAQMEITGGSTLDLSSLSEFGPDDTDESFGLSVDESSTLLLAPAVWLKGIGLGFGSSPGAPRIVPEIVGVRAGNESYVGGDYVILPNLQTIEPGASIRLVGSFELTTLEIVPESSSFSFRGVDLVVPQITSFGPGTEIEISGVLDAPELISMTGSAFIVNPGASVNAPRFTQFLGGEFDIEEDAVFTLPALTDVSGSTVWVHSNSSFTAPSLTSLSQVVFEIVSSSTVTLPALTEIVDSILVSYFGPLPLYSPLLDRVVRSKITGLNSSTMSGSQPSEIIDSHYVLTMDPLESFSYPVVDGSTLEFYGGGSVTITDPTLDGGGIFYTYGGDLTVQSTTATAGPAEPVLFGVGGIDGGTAVVVNPVVVSGGDSESFVNFVGAAGTLQVLWPVSVQMGGDFQLNAYGNGVVNAESFDVISKSVTLEADTNGDIVVNQGLAIDTDQLTIQLTAGGAIQTGQPAVIDSKTATLTMGTGGLHLAPGSEFVFEQLTLNMLTPTALGDPMDLNQFGSFATATDISIDVEAALDAEFPSLSVDFDAFASDPGIDINLRTNASIRLGGVSRVDTITARSNTLIDATGDLNWRLSTDPAAGAAQPVFGTVRFASGGTQHYEAITADVGTSRGTTIKAGPVFEVLADNGPTTVVLRDVFSNSGASVEALYLRSRGSGNITGLKLGPGCVLVLNGVPVYTKAQSVFVWERLADLIPPGEDCVDYDQGQICLSVCVADMNGDGILDNGDIGSFIDLFLAGDLGADVNGDGILDNGDIGAFVAAFLGGC